MMESHAAEEACVPEDESVTGLLQDEVIVLSGPESGRFSAHLPAHAEVKADPITAGKFEEHLLAARVRTQEALSG